VTRARAGEPGRTGSPVAAGSRAAVAALLGAVALAGCGGGSRATRGFDSRELMQVRDATLSLWTLVENGGDPTVIYSTEPAGTTGLNYWSLDTVTGSVENLGTELPAAITAYTGFYDCSYRSSQTGAGYTLEIVDLRTDAETDIDGVISVAACPGIDGTLTTFRADPTTGSLVLWTGPFTDLQSVALSMDVEAVGTWLFDPAGVPSSVLVAAATTDQPNAFGLYTLDLGGYGFTEDVPPAPASTAWASGAPRSGSLQSSSLATGAAQSIRAMGDHFLYTRTMSDGGTMMFAGPFSAGAASELALFQADAQAVSASKVPLYDTTTFFNVGTTAAPPIAAWSPASVAADSSTLMAWNDTTRTVVACPSSAGASLVGALAPGDSRVLFAEDPASGGSAAVTLLSLGAATGGSDSCLALATAGGTNAGFSLDGQALFWTIASGPVQGALWAAAADGTNQRMIGSGAISQVYFFDVHGSERLEFFLDSDFVWVDLADDPIVLHDVVPQVFEGYAYLDNSWMLIGYDFSSQDGTGTLGLVNQDTGAMRPISPDVASFRTALEASTADGGASDAAGSPDGGGPMVYDVIYLVRGHNPSPQDGIWIARVSTADLP
jgi:hypothetical protein